MFAWGSKLDGLNGEWPNGKEAKIAFFFVCIGWTEGVDLVQYKILKDYFQSCKATEVVQE